MSQSWSVAARIRGGSRERSAHFSARPRDLKTSRPQDLKTSDLKTSGPQTSRPQDLKEQWRAMIDSWLPLAPADVAEPFEGLALVFEPDQGSQAWCRQTYAAASRCRGGARTPGCGRRRRHVPHLHPAFRPPAQELDLVGRQTCSVRDDGRGAVVVRDILVDDERPRARNRRSSASADTASGAGCTASRRTAARTPGWPRSTSRVSSGLPTINPPTTNRPCRCRCSIAAIDALPTRAAASAAARSWPRLQEGEIVGPARSRCRGTRSGTRRAASAARASRRARRAETSSPGRRSRCRGGRCSMIAWQSRSKRCTSSVMLSSTRKIARAPCRRASAMSASTRSMG